MNFIVCLKIDSRVLEITPWGCLCDKVLGLGKSYQTIPQDLKLVLQLKRYVNLPNNFFQSLGMTLKGFLREKYLKSPYNQFQSSEIPLKGPLEGKILFIDTVSQKIFFENSKKPVLESYESPLRGYFLSPHALKSVLCFECHYIF